MTTLFRRLVREESGQDIIEYALLAGGIAVFMVPFAQTLGTALSNAYTRITGQVNSLP